MSRVVYSNGEDVTWLDHEGVVRQTDKAVLFKLPGGEERWVPKSLIVDQGEDLVGIQKWWCEKNGIKGDW